ncbi:retrovirus-related Pol polyprotein from transposon TNT 1-94 [Caerostris darwini]|uniref:Retrovirus-related Pol polyprotein from transposon TNT 1-94 n=1 Tax=Caerostris darwini TaxID=1538125 RepID=A0AAV4UTS3_9ARAC|nr:retrovirus-related Pol polyprotein from transposon TNT 1-94 [Caerostris darwini]
MYVTIAFHYDTVNEDVYIMQPKGYQGESRENLSCHLKKTLYGLKQSDRKWNKYFDSFLKDFGLSHSKHNPYIYFHQEKLLYFGLYILIIGKKDTIDSFKLEIMKTIKDKDLGKASDILSVGISRHEDGSIALDQTPNIEDVLGTCKATDVKGASIPLNPSMKHCNIKKRNEIQSSQALGIILYLTCGTHPDIIFNTSLMEYLQIFNGEKNKLRKLISSTSQNENCSFKSKRHKL